MDSPILTRLVALGTKRSLIIGLGLASLFYFTGYDDGSAFEERLQSLQQEIEQEEIKAEETKRLLEDQEKIQEANRTLGENLRIALSRLPTELDSFRLVRDLQRVTRASGAQITNIRPQASRMEEFYEEIPVAVSLEGEFKDLVTFLYYVSGLERVTRVNEFKMATEEKGTERNEKSIIKLETEVISFRYVPGAIEANQNRSSEDNLGAEGEVQ